MASSSQSTLFFLLPLFTILLLVLLPLPAHSLTCTSQKFPQKKPFDHCVDLPTLDAYLHWTYDPAKSALSIAFIAPPAKPDGWIAWALNPTGTGMAGSQALVAFNQPKGGVAVKTYNMSSYSSVVESKLSFPVSDEKAEITDGVITIFATVGLPDNKTSVNQIWQVGSSVTNGKPDKHDFLPQNLGAKATFDFATGANSTSVPATPATPGTPATPKSGGGESSPSKAGAASVARNSRFGVYSVLAIFGSFLLIC